LDFKIPFKANKFSFTCINYGNISEETFMVGLSGKICVSSWILCLKMIKILIIRLPKHLLPKKSSHFNKISSIKPLLSC
jgi:hypothetical protein